MLKLSKVLHTKNMDSKRSRKPTARFVPWKKGDMNASQCLRNKFRINMEPKNARKPPARFVPWEEGDKYAPQSLRKNKSWNKQEQKGFRKLSKEKVTTNNSVRESLQLEVKGDTESLKQKEKPTKKVKETNCGEKGKNKVK